MSTIIVRPRRRNIVVKPVERKIVITRNRLPGPRGPVGPQGVSGGSHTHVQSLPSDTWVINHVLDYYPNVTAEDSSGAVIQGDVIYNSSNQLTIVFAAAFSGRAFLS